MGNAYVSMETISRAKDVVESAYHMKNIEMENVNASMDICKDAIKSILANVVYFNASHMKYMTMEYVCVSMD